MSTAYYSLTSPLWDAYECFAFFCCLWRYFFQEWDDRLEEDSLLIERILLLIRNILHIPANKQAEKVHVNIDISNALYSL